MEDSPVAGSNLRLLMDKVNQIARIQAFVTTTLAPPGLPEPATKRPASQGATSQPG